METWRILATALFGAAGLTLALFVMAKVREKTESAGPTAVSGAMVLAATAILAVLILTVLAPWLSWTLVIVAAVTVMVMVLAS